MVVEPRWVVANLGMEFFPMTGGGEVAFAGRTVRASVAAMADKAVELNVAGQTCRVVTTATETELKVLASMVEEKLARIVAPGRPVTTQAMLLAAVALAHDVQEQRTRADRIAQHARRTLETLLERVDGALGEGDGAGRREAIKSRTGAPAAGAGGDAEQRAVIDHKSSSREARVIKERGSARRTSRQRGEASDGRGDDHR